MSPEDFTNPNHSNHPEVVDNPEAMQPASEATKQALLDTVTTKSEGGYDFGSEVSRTLVFPEAERGTVSVARFRDGASKDDPSRMARIHRVEWPAKVYGEQLITNYFVVNSPDGLQMEKHSHTFDPDKELLDDSATLEDTGVAATNGLAKILAMQKSQAVEDELGLSFVSEAEAKALLALVEEAQPTR